MVLPSGVSEPVWGLDDGKKSSGHGTIELSLSDDGRVTGSATGALGDLVIEGTTDKDALSASVAPSNGKGFRGIVTGTVSDGIIHGNLEVSSSDASIVREAALMLTAERGK